MPITDLQSLRMNRLRPSTLRSRSWIKIFINIILMNQLHSLKSILLDEILHLITGWQRGRASKWRFQQCPSRILSLRRNFFTRLTTIGSSAARASSSNHSLRACRLKVLRSWRPASLSRATCSPTGLGWQQRIHSPRLNRAFLFLKINQRASKSLRK